MSGGRYYRLPDRRIVPSVSAVIDALSKPALTYWAAKVVAESAVKDRDYWSDLDDEVAVGWLKKATYRTTKKAADRGRDVHTAIETGDWRGVEAFRPAYDNMVAAHGEPRILVAEKVVWTDQYAGRLDCVAEFDSGLFVVDWKTTGAVRASTELQLAAYAEAFDRMEGSPLLDGAVVVRLTDGGEFEWVEYTNEELCRGFETFMSLLAVMKWQVKKGELYGPSDVIDVTA